MAWGAGSSRQEDPFAAAERDVRAMVSANWWPSAPAQQRQHSIAGRILVLPDGSQWLFGAWARWYRSHPADQQWYLCPPPHSAITRLTARTAQSSAALPPHVVPSGPDFKAQEYELLPFVGADLKALTARVRATVEASAQLSAADHPRPEGDIPRWWQEFSPTAPMTVAATWGVTLWCAGAPAFDARLDDQLLGLWSPYREQQLPAIDGPRWLTPPTLGEVVGLYAERLRAHRVDAAVVVLRTMWATASALRDERRFTARADALLAILGATLKDPTMDYTALPHGDEAVVQQWLTRCPPELTPALRPETSAGDNFRHAFYALSESLVKASGPADQPTFVEPRLIAATLLAADVSVIRQDVIDQVIPWLDPEIRFTVQAMITQPGHPLRRRFWPVDGRLPEQLRTGLTRRREQVLGAMYALDLGWCRLGGGIPSRPRGFPSTTALLAEIIGPERASATTAAPTPPAPAPVPQPAWQSPAQAPGMPPLPAPGELPPLPWGAQQPAAEPAVGAWGAPGQGQPSQQPYGQPAAAQQHPGFPQTPQQDPFGRQPDSQAPYGQQPAPGQQGFGQPAHQPASPPARQPAHGQPGAGGQPSYGPPGAVGQPGADGQPGYVSAGANQQPGQAGADQGGFGPPGDQAAAAQQQGVPQEQGPRRPPAVQRGPTADELAQQAGKVFGNVFGRARQLGGRLLGGGGEPDPHTTGPLGFDQPDGPRQPPVPQPEVGEPPRTRVAPAHGTRIMSETMVGDFLDFAPVPQQPVGDIAPPPDDDAGSTTRRAGVAFVSGPDDDAGTFLDGLPKSDNAALSAQVTGPVRIDPQATMVDQRAVRDAVNAANPTVRDPGPHRDATNATMLDRDLPQGGRFDSSATMVDRGGAGGFDPGATMMDGGGTPGTGPGAAPPAVSVLLVGGAHTGQRRFARMVALTVGDGTLHGSDAEDLRGLALERLATLFDPPGSVLLLERVDAAMLEAPDPQAFLRTLLAIRARARTPMVATCDPRSYKRLVQDHPELASAFRVFRLPELRADDQRLSLLRVLADERRASLDAGAWEIAAQDLARLRGPGDLTAARLVEAYLDRACQRALGRGGGAGDRLVLTAADFAGIAESIEPALRPAGDADAYLRLLGEMIGLNSVKAAVQRLAAEADAPVNLLLEGPPGCGKATVAGIIGGIFGAVGVLPSGHVITCRPVHLHGRDDLETELRVAGMVQQADGGLLLVQEADQLTPDIVSELFRGLREHRFMLVLAGGSMGRMLDANPDIRATFQQLDFEPLSDRELVQLFQQLAEKKLYLLEEELRIELMTRFARARDGEGFAFGRTVRAMFEETAARQARRLSGVHGADARTVARLTTRDLPESNLERIMGDLHRADPR